MKFHLSNALRTALVLVTYCVSGSLLAADSNELLISVSDDELAQAQSENDWFLNDYLYFAKRHRIVRINEAALMSLEPMTISLFPDTRVTAQREELKKVPSTTLRWVGEIFDPTSGNFGLNVDSDHLDEIIGPLTELKISGVFYDIDIATGDSYVPHSKWSTKGYSRPIEASRMESAAHLAIGAFVLSPELENVYKIQSLNATPEYHLVYEIDPAREYVHEQMDDPVLESENATRREQHRLHKEAIGESPSVAWAQNVKAAAAKAAKNGDSR